MARKLTEPKLLLATHNQGKVREIAALVRPFGKTVVSAGELDLPEPEETETSFIGNASIKALAGAKASGLPALSDDSGLCVDALGGAPGVYTADWAERQPVEADALGGPGRDWYLAMGKVEGKLAQQGPLIDRSAAFKCALCLAWPDGHVEAFEGHVSGRLTWTDSCCLLLLHLWCLSL
ncbi:MAG: non-canonical purine NTP pyrophosphatase, partial [Pseudomonadota bacterium]